MIVNQYSVPWWQANRFIKEFCSNHLVCWVEVESGEDNEMKIMIFHEGVRGRC